MNESDIPDVRIGDTEREEALNSLGDHMSAGRLDIDEYGDRSARVTTARTRSELAAIFADLPEPKPTFDAPALIIQPQPAPTVAGQRPGWRGIPREFTGPIICLTWVSAIFIGPALGLHWLFGVAIVLSIILGFLTRKSSRDSNRELPEQGRDRRRIVRDEMRERRRELRSDDQ